MLDKNIIDAALHEIEVEVIHLKTVCRIIVSANTSDLEKAQLHELYGDILHKALRIEEATERLGTMLLEVPQ